MARQLGEHIFFVKFGSSKSQNGELIMSENESAGFRVVDRRRFTSEGDTRADTSQHDTQNRESDARGASKPHAKPATSTVNQSVQPSMNEAAHSEEESAEVNFESFVISMATQTLVMLGAVPHPETGQSVQNVAAAQQSIDILAVIEQKTRGNLTSSESELLKEVLTSLRLEFVNRTRASSVSR